MRAVALPSKEAIQELDQQGRDPTEVCEMEGVMEQPSAGAFEIW